MSVDSVVETTQYLTFTLDGELFAFDICQVREVLNFTTPTKVPQTPDYMRGVINLRGNVVPVIDLRRKFGMPQAVPTVHSCIIIVEVVLGGETVVIGAMADAVQEVLDLEPEQIEPPPRLGTKLDTSFIVGMGKTNGEFIIILDIDRVFAEDELEVMKELGDGAQLRMEEAEVQAASA